MSSSSARCSRLRLNFFDPSKNFRPLISSDESERRARLAPLRKDVKAAEERVVKIEAMKAKIDLLLADPDLYMKAEAGKFEQLQKKRAEVIDGLERAEGIWLKAQERLEAAQRG